MLCNRYLKFNTVVLKVEAQAIKLSEARSKAELTIKDLYRRIEEAINSRARKYKS